MDGAVPHPTTLMKLTSRCGSTAVDGLNEALLAKAAEAKVLRTNRVRADTSVVPANVCYPTESGLLAKAIRRIGAAGQRIHNAGGAVRTRLRDRSRAAGKRAGGQYVHEEWNSGEGYRKTLAAVRSPLPIGSALQGIPWCGEDDTVPFSTQWVWVTALHAPAIVVTVEGTNDDADPARLYTQKFAHDLAGCKLR